MPSESSPPRARAIASATGSSGAADAPLQLAILLVVAAALRLYELGSPLWYDEIVTLVEFVRLPVDDLLTSYPSTNNHVLYSLLAHGSIAVLGESAFALRLPAAVLGVASLAACWWMAHEILPARQARLATWAVALAYHHVWFSQNARGYTGILLATWLGTALFLRARREPRTATWIAYAATLAIGSGFHLSALLAFAAHGLVWLVDVAHRRRIAAPVDLRPLGAFALGLALLLLLYAPLLPSLLETLEAQRTAGRGAATVRTWKSPLWTALEIVRGLPFGAASLPAAIVGGAIGATGLVALVRRRPFGAALLVVPPALTLVALLAIGFNVWPRYFLASLGFAAVIGVHGLFVATAALWDGDRVGRIATAAALVTIAASAATLPRNYRHPKQDWPGARDWIEAHRRPGEPVRTLGLASFAFGRYYEPAWAALESSDELDRLRREHARFWIVYSFPMHLRGTRPTLFQRIEDELTPVARFPGTLGGGDVTVVAPAGAAAAAETP